MKNSALIDQSEKVLAHLQKLYAKSKRHFGTDKELTADMEALGKAIQEARTEQSEKPKLVVVLNEGLLEGVFGDRAVDIDFLKADLDDDALEPEIYRQIEVEVDPDYVAKLHRNAEAFWAPEDNGPSK